MPFTMFPKLVLSFSLYILISFSKNTLPQTFQCQGLKCQLLRESFSNQMVDLSTPDSQSYHWHVFSSASTSISSSLLQLKCTLHENRNLVCAHAQNGAHSRHSIDDTEEKNGPLVLERKQCLRPRGGRRLA